MTTMKTSDRWSKELDVVKVLRETLVIVARVAAAVAIVTAAFALMFFVSIASGGSL
ncbi:MAG TPA: hypothetical protein VHJ34_07070 [Actinomycetota bacterium]|nr:hypothetical protein [Actinomycetota bacterium]